MRIAFAVPAAIIVFVAACTRDVAPTAARPTPVNVNLDVVSGSGQTGTAGQALAKPIVVKVVDASLGIPVPGYLVNWVITTGAGSTFVAATETNFQGITQNYWTLGGAVGSQTLEVRAISPINGQKITFATVTATAIGSTGNVIAFMSDRSSSNGNNDIYSMNLDGSGLRQLTSGGFDNLHPMWSPDGSQIVMYSTRNGSTNVYTMNADGSNLTRLTTNPYGDGHPSWSPDGKTIAYQCVQASGIHNVCLMNPDGSNIRNITNTPYHDFDPEWSPDGKELVFDCFLDGTQQLCTMNVDGSGLHQITSGAVNRTASWSPKGDKIAFTSTRDGNDEIYTINVDGTGATRLTNNNVDDDFVSWSPDGSRLVFSSTRAGGKFQLYTMSPDGSNVTALASSSGNDRAPAWK